MTLIRILASFILAFSIFISGCNMFSGVYRTPLKTDRVRKTVDLQPEKLVIAFQQTVKGARLDETVWDNFSGPYRDSIEAGQIGFTQHRNFWFAPIVPYGTVMAYKVNSQIIVPFGNLLSQTLISSVDSTRSKVGISFDGESTIDLFNSKHPTTLLSVKVDSFFVWEEPQNHLNYSCLISTQLWDSSGNIVGTYKVQKSSLDNELGGVLSSSGTFLTEMNATARRFTDDIVDEILSKLSK